MLRGFVLEQAQVLPGAALKQAVLGLL